MTNDVSGEEWAQRAKTLPDHDRTQVARAADVLLRHTVAISDVLETELYTLLDFLRSVQNGTTR